MQTDYIPTPALDKSLISAVVGGILNNYNFKINHSNFTNICNKNTIYFYEDLIMQLEFFLNLSLNLIK